MYVKSRNWSYGRRRVETPAADRMYLGLSVAFAVVATLAATLAGVGVASADPWSPSLEESTLAKTFETTGGLANRLDELPAIAEKTMDYQRKRAEKLQADPERRPNPNSCSIALTCLINPDVTEDTWRNRGGSVEQVLYTSRSGATISGHIWDMPTEADQARKPGVIVNNGSLLAYEESYWYLAQNLASAGYLVFTYDTQGEGMSDQFGEAPDEVEAAFAGIPILGLAGPQANGNLLDSLGGNGLPFYDGQIDALDFFLSSPAQIYAPQPSRTSGTDHSDKQRSRVSRGLNAAYNPLWERLDPSRVGLTGHSYGGVAASWNAQNDPRVKAAVALDSQCVPAAKPLDEMVAFTTARAAQALGPVSVPLAYGFNKYCFGAPDVPAPQLRTPVLGMSGDYLAFPIPRVQPPDPLAKSEASYEMSAHGIDSGDIVIRAANHLDFADTAGLLPGTFDAKAIVSYYTIAWFDKYLKVGTDADERLTGAPWRNVPTPTAAGENNRFSAHYNSRIAIRRDDGSTLTCNDLRAGCS